MRRLLLTLSVLISAHLFAQVGEITLTDENVGNSFAQNVLLLEDPDHDLELAEVLNLPDEAFYTPKNDIPNLDFTASSWWMKFTVHNESSFSYFILETARPITNKVNFFEVRGSTVENAFISGDDYHYKDKAIPHNCNLFPLTIYPGQSKSYYVKMVSDGEVITLPVKIDNKTRYFENDATQQFGHGFYYGLMYLVVVIYFFFYLLLKDVAFFYYIIYVAAQALLQFALDGYVYRYFFPGGGYLANHFVVFIAGITVIVLLTYVINFLELKEQDRGMLKIFRVCQFLVLGTTLISLIPGQLYEISYPVINGVSLLSIILSVVAIYRLRFRKIHVDIYFTIAFTVLIVGAVIFILGNFNLIGDAEIAQNALKISSGLEVTILSISMSNKYRRLQREKQEAQAAALKNLEEKNALMDDINAKLERQVKERTVEIERQKEELAEINQEILSSIHYAKRIQTAILPSSSHVEKLLPESFVFYRPKDVVSGDFYFVEQATPSNGTTPLTVFAAVDCTGHGVPGAFMSIVGNNYLTAGLTEPSVNNTGDALNFLNQGVVSALRQDKEKDETVRDGMDIALCALDQTSRVMYFSGAKNPVYIVRKAEKVEELGFDYEQGAKNLLKSEVDPIYLCEIKGDSHPIGSYIGDELKPFTTHEIELREGDMIYVFSDGYADQFGGESGKKYKYKTFKKFLLKISQLPAAEQREKLIEEYDRWKGDFEQIDDVLVIGVRI
ncbi:MAG: SpoIIE family protein phosphatase [Crocinitomicaceae bacterium]|nr:SpoIIE family protein phosphatase [Crocinitomicaceae bacterium]